MSNDTVMIRLQKDPYGRDFNLESEMLECFDGPAAPQQGMLGALIVWWPASFWLQWTMAKGTVHTGSPAKFPTKPTEEFKKNENVCYKTN